MKRAKKLLDVQNWLRKPHREDYDVGVVSEKWRSVGLRKAINF